MTVPEFLALQRSGALWGGPRAELIGGILQVPPLPSPAAVAAIAGLAARLEAVEAEGTDWHAGAWNADRDAADGLAAGGEAAGERTAGERTAGERTAGEHTAAGQGARVPGARGPGVRDRGVRMVQDRVVRFQPPLRLGSEDLLRPDLVLFEDQPRFGTAAAYAPEDARLIAEVVRPGASHDVRLPRYAAARVPDVWLLDVERGWAEVYRAPAAGSFRSRTLWYPGEKVRVAALGSVAVEALAAW